jgi:hypothetical protein
VGEGLWEIGGTKFYEKDIESAAVHPAKPPRFLRLSGAVYGDRKIRPDHQKIPFCRGASALYTNGTLACEASLKELGEAASTKYASIWAPRLRGQGD